MKNMIFNAMVMSADDRAQLQEDFAEIFLGILKNRKIHSIGINELGLLSVIVEDVDTKRLMELDSLSSGEKNLILTFLLISRSLEAGGIALFDEPELHLNPMICKEMLNFILSEYSLPKNIQFIICSHSPEILSGAFSSDDCTLLYIKDALNVTRIGRLAVDEYSDALNKIGASVSEGLLYKGTVFVEGVDDVDFLSIAFGGNILKQYLVRELGGRREVEKTARQLQRLEADGKQVSPILIIIDKDREKTSLSNSAAVKILQWPRFCLENYLLDFELIASILKDNKVSSKNDFDETGVSRKFRELAMTQLNEIAAREVFMSFNFQSVTFQSDDLDKGSLQEISNAMFYRLKEAQNSLNVLDESGWLDAFHGQCERRQIEIRELWEVKWKELCNGKRLFQDFQKQGFLKTSANDFKRKIMHTMKDNASENWRVLQSLIKENLAGA